MTPIKSTYALYTVAEVESYLVSLPNSFDFKRGHELLAGGVRAKYCMTGTEKNVGVGFRLAEAQTVPPMDRPSLSNLLKEFNLDDRDVDIVIGNDDWLAPLQVTRLEERGKGSTPMERLNALLYKKMLVQRDPRLELVVLMDETFDLKYDDTCDYLAQLSVPYGRISLIGQIGTDPKLGQFHCIEIFPELTQSLMIEIRML